MSVRVRFAPSPTGHLHIGGGRTALFNYFFARHHGGKFILRIEDTDQERSTQESTDGILHSLKWLGLDIDEGPFFQAQNFPKHRQAAEDLVKKGLAYPCYCSIQELEAMREAATKAGQKPRYDGRCRALNAAPDGKNEIKPVIRFKTPQSGKVAFDDLVRKRIEFDCAELDDLILLRSDGTPTYNLCVVLDDIEMKITHVIRGDDHINNTPRQILLYEALNSPKPEFAHLSMILGPDKKKLSKRHNVPSILVYRDMGFLPEALVNYLIRLGWSYGDQEVFSHDELIKYFSLDSITVSAAALNPEKLLWINGHYIRSTPAKDLWPPLRDLLKNDGHTDFPEETFCLRLIDLLKERCKTLVEMKELTLPFLQKEMAYDAAAVEKFLNPGVRGALQDLTDQISGLSQWEPDKLKTVFEGVIATHKLKMVELAQPTRVALTGKTISPGIFEVMEILGKEQTLKRLQAGIQKINRV